MIKITTRIPMMPKPVPAIAIGNIRALPVECVLERLPGRSDDDTCCPPAHVGARTSVFERVAAFSAFCEAQ
jgi:hypothetical protein